MKYCQNYGPKKKRNITKIYHCLLGSPGTHQQLWNHYEQYDLPNTHQPLLHLVGHQHLENLYMVCALHDSGLHGDHPVEMLKAPEEIIKQMLPETRP